MLPKVFHTNEIEAWPKSHYKPNPHIERIHHPVAKHVHLFLECCGGKNDSWIFTSFQPGPSRSSKVKWSAYVRPACKIASDKLRPNLIFDQPNHWIRHLHAASNSFQHQFDGSSSSFLLRYHLDRCWEFSLCQMIWSFELRCILFRHFQATLAFWLSPPPTLTPTLTLTPQSQTPVLDIASRSLICAPRSLLVNEFPCW